MTSSHSITRPGLLAVAAPALAMLVLAGCSGPAADDQAIILQDETPAASATTDAPSTGTSPTADPVQTSVQPSDQTATPAPASTMVPDATASPTGQAAGGVDAAGAEQVALDRIGSGTVLYVEDDRDDGRETFEVHVEDGDGTWWEVTVDALTGEIQEVDREDDTITAPAAAVDEVTAREAATGQTGADEVLGARFEADDDGDHWDVRLRDPDGRILEVSVDATTGEVLDVDVED